MFGGAPRPTAVAVAADGHAYVVFARARSIVRIIDPVAVQPDLQTVGFTAGSGARAIVAGPPDESGRVAVYLAEETTITLHRPPVGDRGSETATTMYAAGPIGSLQFDPGRSILYAGTTDSAGKPPRLASQPGVESKKVKVVKNIPIARALPMAHTFGDTARSAIIAAMAISTTPSTAEKARTLKML